MDQMIAMSVGLMAVASALLVMAIAVKIMGTMSGKQLIKGMMAITYLSLMLAGTSRLLAGASKDMIKGAIGMTILFSLILCE